MPNISDRVADRLIQRQIQTLRASEGLSGEVLRELRKAQESILETLKSKPLTSYTAARMRRMLGEIREVLSEFTKETFQKVRADIPEIAVAITAKTASDLDSIINLDLFSNTFDARKALNAFDDQVIFSQSMKKFWSKQSSELMTAYRSAMKESVALGETPAELLKRVRQDPRINMKAGQYRTAVRTSTMNLANTGRMQMYRENGDILKGMQWLSTLDSRTSPICQGLDRLTWSLDLEPIGHDKRFPGATAHPNCRSTQLPLIRSFAELAGRNKALASKLDSALSPRTRASMDGQVAADLSYSDWLRTKGDDFALEILGETRFKLWKEGTLELRDMLDQSSKPLSTSKLTKLLEIPTAENWRKQLKAWMLEQKTEELRGVTNYMSGSHLINSFLRGDVEDMTPSQLERAYEEIISIDSLIAKAPKSKHSFTLYRGSHRIEDLDSAFTSASTDLTVALDFVNDQEGAKLIRLSVPAGERMLAGNEDELEFILQRGGQFRVLKTSIQQFDGKNVEVVDVEWLGAEVKEIIKPVTFVYPKTFKDAHDWIFNNKLNLNASESYISNLNYEVLVVTDKNGKFSMVVTQGEQYGVNVEPWRYPHMKNMVVTHNHPDPVAFSLQDIQFASRVDAAEMRAVAGGQMIYSMTAPNGWPTQGDLVDAWNHALRIMYDRRFMNQTLLLEELWKITANKLGLVFKKEPLP